MLLREEFSASSFGPFSITHAGRLEEALSLLGLGQFDAVLLDLGLPDSDGLATLERMRKEKARDIPIVVVAGLGEYELRVQALRCGADDYLIKGVLTDNERARLVRYAIERKRAREAIFASEALLALAVDAAQMGIFDWDLQSHRLTMSPHHARLFGVNLETFAGTCQAFEACIHADDRAVRKVIIEQALAGGEEYQHEYRVVWPDASRHWIAERGRVFLDAQGRPVRMMGTVVDVSARKAGEDSAKAREAQLAQLCRISTMGQMAAGLAHELNHPLTAVLSYAAVCLEQIESQKDASQTLVTAMQGVISETRRAGAIISKMRSFLRKQPLQLVPLDINELVRESVYLMESELRLQRIRPHLELRDDLPRALGDAVQIEQVLINLIFNALEAMGGVKSTEHCLTVRTELDDDGCGVRVWVIDAGGGMAPENMGHLFEPFFTTKPGGLGMGLNICRSIIANQGGRMGAELNPDRGMRFFFTVPLA